MCPVAAYVGETAAAEPDARVTVLIAEVEPERCGSGCCRTSGARWSRTPLRRDTDVVICRLRFRVS